MGGFFSYKISKQTLNSNSVYLNLCETVNTSNVRFDLGFKQEVELSDVYRQKNVIFLSCTNS